MCRWDVHIKCLLICGYTMIWSAAKGNATDSFPAIIANGYDSLRLEHKMSQCVEGEVKKIIAREAVVSFNKVERWSKLGNQLNFYIPGSVFLKSNTELGRFVLRARDSSRTSTYLLRSKVTVEKEVLMNAHTLDDHIDLDDGAFRAQCGTQYISLTETGGELNVGIKFSFASSNHKEEFDAGGAITSIAGLGAHIQNLHQDIRKRSSMEIFFHQSGGRLQDLEEMFESHDVASCSLENFDFCKGMIENIWDYATDRFAKSIGEGHTQVIGFRTSDFVDRQRVYEDPQLIKGRKYVLDFLERHFRDRDYIASLIVSGNEYEDCDGRCLSEISSQISSNIRDLKGSVRMSFLEPDRFIAFSMVDDLELYSYTFPKVLPPRTSVIHRWGRYIGGGLILITIAPVIVKVLLSI